MKPELVVIAALAGLGVIAYFQLRSSARGTPYEGTGPVGLLGHATNQTLGGIPQAMGEKLGGTLFDVFGPDEESEDLYYNIMFPDGNRHAIPSSDVDSRGQFSYAGKRYQLQSSTTGGRYARLL